MKNILSHRSTCQSTSAMKIVVWCLWFVLWSFEQISGLSYNQPNLDPYATWNPNAILFTNSSMVGANPRGLFIDSNDSIYVVDQTNNRIVVWMNDSSIPTTTIYGNMSKPMCIFVTSNGDIYISDYTAKNQTSRWSLNANGSIPVMYGSSSCYGLFVDTNDTLYCALYNEHKVVKKWLGDNGSAITIVAGSGSAGSTSYQLNNPEGVFVTADFDLYVADYRNNRIQLFRHGETNGTTVAGNSSLHFTIALWGPNAVILDLDGYLFVADGGNNRIVGSGPYGFRCLVGCTGMAGSATNQLKGPWNLAFDRHGDLYASEWSTNRILKYVLLNNTLGKCSSKLITRI
ncbi:unnamed protein product [Adineta ricciae]|uniref:NHL repeat containing protein-like protein n=1 Tax=Adineta ricciae TaxID=249248 RepID=A0A816H3H6_ADIRI|nr:unnamed protein product [Adineta ricciae]